MKQIKLNFLPWNLATLVFVGVFHLEPFSLSAILCAGQQT